MLAWRRALRILLGIYLGLVAGGFVIKLLHPGLGWAIALFVVAGALGGAASAGEARKLQPWTSEERDNALLGWGIVLGLLLLLPAATIPMSGGVRIVVVAAVVLLIAGILLWIARGPFDAPGAQEPDARSGHEALDPD